MAENRSSVDAQLQQLGEARTLVLKDPGYWPQVLQGTLPIITGPTVEVRRWGADFLAETFSTPLVDARAKQELALACLDTLLRLANETETGILKSVAQCSASVYPIIFRHMYVSCPLLACHSPRVLREFSPPSSGQSDRSGGNRFAGKDGMDGLLSVDDFSV